MHSMRFPTRIQFFVPFVAVMVVMIISITQIVRKTIQRERDNLQLRLDHIVMTLENARFPWNQTVMEQMKGLTGAEYCLYRSSNKPMGTLDRLPQLESLAIDNSSTGLGEAVAIDGVEYFVRTYRRPTPGPRPDEVLLVLYPVVKWNETVAAVIRPLLLYGGLGMIVAALLTLILGRHFANRIRDVEVQSRRIAAGDFAIMPLPAGNDELRDLAISVNQMAQQLQSLHNSLRDAERWRLLGQLAGGLAHQLRNGVTGARLALQVAERETGFVAEPIAVALRQLKVMEIQLQRFLELGRQPRETAVVCDVARTAAEAIELLQPRIQHVGIQFKTRISEHIPPLHADPEQLAQIIINLLDNAVSACGPGGLVELKLGHGADSVVIEVFDNGFGPPPEIAERIFEPFVTGKSDGIGLGLAVVQKVVEELHGKLGWDRNDSRTRFWVKVPIAHKLNEQNQ